MFGWKLGIVEAVSLSILVGNALDYCIHLSEGYMAVDNRHLAFVDRFKVNIPASAIQSYGTPVSVCMLIHISYSQIISENLSTLDKLFINNRPKL